MKWRFADCVLDTELFELRRGAQLRKIEPKVFDVLLFLIEHRDRVVSKQELLDRVWSGEVVNESVLPRCVALARQAVGDDRATQRIIQTVHGRGYRFVAEADGLAAATSEPTADASPAGVDTDFVGRREVLERLELAFADALGRHGRVVLLAGEPGIGKTRTAEHQVERWAARASAHVGRCFEGEGAPAYWPVVQILRSVIERIDDRLDADLRADASDLVALLPELADRLSPGVPSVRVGGEHARFRLFDSLTRFLRRCAARRPLVLVIDDLHWADRDSLELLGFLARNLRDSQVLLFSTYRDVEVRRDHPLRKLLGELARLPHCERITLRGLGADEVRELVDHTVGAAVGDALAAAITEVTQGNPFFVREMARLLPERESGESESGPQPELEHSEQIALELPQSVRDAVGRRLDALTPECNEWLRDAAVLGREFDGRLLAEVRGEEPEVQLQRADEALASGVIQSAAGPARYAFAHALVQQTLYEELQVAERVAAHRRCAEALERLHGDGANDHLEELAHHLFEAAIGGDAARSVEVSVRAAELAHRRFAYGEAARHYERAREMMALDAAVDEGRRCELMLAEGESRWAVGDRDNARERFRQAAGMARELERADLFARAAVGMRGYRYLGIVIESDSVDLLEEAIELVADDHPLWRARALSRLVFSEPHCFEMAERRRLSEEASALCQETTDPAVLFDVITARYWAHLGPDAPDERIAIGREALQHGRRLGSPELSMLGNEILAGAHLLQGDLGEMARNVAAFERIANELRQPVFQFLASIQRGTYAMNCGRFEEAQRSLDRAAERGQSGIERSESLTAGAQYWLRGLRGDPGDPVEYDDAFRELLDRTPEFGNAAIIKAGGASQLARVGRLAEAREGLKSQCARLDRLEHDEHWLVTFSLLADLAVELEEPEIAEALIEQLLPFEPLVFTHDLIPATNGTVRSALGSLAGACGRKEEAAERLVAAIEWEDSIGAQPAALTSRTRLVRLWQREGHSDRASEVYAVAAAASERMGRVGPLPGLVDPLET